MLAGDLKGPARTALPTHALQKGHTYWYGFLVCVARCSFRAGGRASAVHVVSFVCAHASCVSGPLSSLFLFCDFLGSASLALLLFSTEARRLPPPLGTCSVCLPLWRGRCVLLSTSPRRCYSFACARFCPRGGEHHILTFLLSSAWLRGTGVAIGYAGFFAAESLRHHRTKVFFTRPCLDQCADFHH